MKVSQLQTKTISILAKEQYGSLLRAAVAWELHPHTVYKLARGERVSRHTRERVEAELGLPIDVLLQPITQVLAGRHS